MYTHVYVYIYIDIYIYIYDAVIYITITIHGSKARINHPCADSFYRPFTTCQKRWGQAHLLLIQAWHREAKASADATRTARLRKAGLF